MKCEQCGCEEFEYIEGKKNSVTKTKFILGLIIAALIVIGMAGVYYISVIGIVIAFFVKPILSIAERIQQTRTYTKVVCKKCQHIKYLE